MSREREIERVRWTEMTREDANALLRFVNRLKVSKFYVYCFAISLLKN